MRINNNISALNAWRGLTNTDTSLTKSLEKLSSGLRINRAGDDAAGLAISEKMRGQVRGLNQAMRNAQDGISLIQTAEGAMNETHSILQRMRELAVQASNDTLATEDRTAIQNEVDQLTSELTRIAFTTQFNGKALLNGVGASSLDFQIGANAGQKVNLSIGNMSAAELGLMGDATVDPTGTPAVATSHQLDVGSYTVSNDQSEILKGTEVVATWDDTAKAYLDSDGNAMLKMASDAKAVADKTIEVKAVDLSSNSSASGAITKIETAINSVSSQRSSLGAMQNRLEHTIKNLGVAAENLAAAESRIRDVDMAAEMMNFTKQNILMQAGTAMLAQANARPQSVLQLLG